MRHDGGNCLHASVQPGERVCIRGWRDGMMRGGFVIRPPGDGKALVQVHPRLYTRVKHLYRTGGGGELPRDLNITFCACLMRHIGDPRQDRTRHQVQRETV